MKRRELYIIFFILSWSVMVLNNSCKKVPSTPPELTQEEKLTQHEQKIINKIDDFMPDEVVATYKNSLNNIRNENDYALYLDSLEIEIDELKNTIELNFSLSEFEDALKNSLLSLQSQSKGAMGSCYLGLGYAKGVKIDTKLSGEIGAGIVAGLQAAGGGGIKTIYDFVNMDREVYSYIFCSEGVTLGIGAALGLSAGLGFTGINEVITGIRFHGSKSGVDKFVGDGLSSSYSLGAGIAAGLKISVSLGIGTSRSARADFTNVENLGPCPLNMVAIENEIKGYSFQAGASISAGILVELKAAYENNYIATHSWGISRTYKKFVTERSLAGTRMAKEILKKEILPGISSAITGFDLAAAATAIIYRNLDFLNCPADKPSIGTKAITKISSTDAEGGGIITNDGGSNVTNRGVCWSTSTNPTVSNSHTEDGIGTGYFTSKLTGLIANTTYYIRAYATNTVGTTYGTQEYFKSTTSSGTIPTNGLVAYFPFNGNANDQSGNNNNGTVHGAILTADRHGISNRAYLFNGVDNYIEINHSSSLNLSQQISISFWAKLETESDYYWPYHIIEKYGCWGTGQREDDVAWGVTTTTGEFSLFALNYDYGRFYHFVMIYDGSKISIYTDGVLKESINATGTILQNSNNIYISRYNFGGNYFFDGVLDDFRIYNRALTQQEITALYNE